MNDSKKNLMRVMIFEPLGDGGITHYTYNLIKVLNERLESVILFTAKNYEFNSENIAFIVYKKMFRFAFFLIRIMPWLKKETSVPSIIRRVLKLFEYPINSIEAILITFSNNINIVHFQSINLIELIMVIGTRIINKKVVYTIHNVMPRHQKLYFYHRFLYRIMYSLCNEVIIHSEKGKEEIIDLYRVRPNKIHVIPHGDYKFFILGKQLSNAEAKIGLGMNKDCKTILFFGAIRENKGLKYILEALPYIKNRVPHIKLMIVGEPWENYSSYKKIIIEKNIEKEVYEKLDYVPNEEVYQYFFAADLVALPYNEITQSGILQIAYAFGKPVVATDLGGFREAIEDGQNGYLVPLNDTQALAERCIEILIDNEKIKRMGYYSRFLSDTKFSWDSIADKTMEVYKKCLAE